MIFNLCMRVNSIVGEHHNLQSEKAATGLKKEILCAEQTKPVAYLRMNPMK